MPSLIHFVMQVCDRWLISLQGIIIFLIFLLLIDHDIVFMESSLKAAYVPPAKRKQVLWSRVDIDQLKNFVNRFTSSFLNDYSANSQVEQMWEEFKTMCFECMNIVPSRLTKVGQNKPWITAQTKRFIRKKSVCIIMLDCQILQKTGIPIMQLKKLLSVNAEKHTMPI